MALLDDVRELLVNAGVAEGGTGWKIFNGFLPTSPNKCVVIYETAGGPPETRFNLDYPTFQVRGRGDKKGYSGLRSKMQEVYEALHNGELDSAASPTGKYVLCRAVQSGPLPLGEDENQRPGLTWNFQVISHR